MAVADDPRNRPAAPAPAAAPAPVAPGASDPAGSFGWFAVQILHGIGAPVNPQNYAFMVAWMRHEHGGGGGANNPLNTTESWAGATNFNSVGVKNYVTAQDGVQALVQNLTGGHYNAIVDALRTGQPDAAFGAIDEFSTFSGGNGTSYANAVQSLYRQILGDPTAGGQTVSGGGSTARTATPGENNPGLMASYGFLWNDPEVGPILRAAASDPNYDPSVFADQIQATNWWKSHSATSRNWLQLQYSDPASFKQQWATALGQTEKLAQDYGIDTTSKQAQDSMSSLTMTYDQNALQQQFVKQTEALYPHLTPQLQDGLTLRDIAQPYLTQASNLLERPADSFSLSDPKFSVPLAFHDGKTVRQMTTNEWATTLMSNQAYGWDHTSNAIDAATNLKQELSQDFGVAA